jgi:hypothetical protein
MRILREDSHVLAKPSRPIFHVIQLVTNWSTRLGGSMDNGVSGHNAQLFAAQVEHVIQASTNKHVQWNFTVLTDRWMQLDK